MKQHKLKDSVSKYHLPPKEQGFLRELTDSRNDWDRKHKVDQEHLIQERKEVLKHRESHTETLVLVRFSSWPHLEQFDQFGK